MNNYKRYLLENKKLSVYRWRVQLDANTVTLSLTIAHRCWIESMGTTCSAVYRTVGRKALRTFRMQDCLVLGEMGSFNPTRSQRNSDQFCPLLHLFWFASIYNIFSLKFKLISHLTTKQKKSVTALLSCRMSKSHASVLINVPFLA